MSPRTIAGIRGATRMVGLLAAVSPVLAEEFAADLTAALQPTSPVFHPQRLAAEAAENAVLALSTSSDPHIPGADL